MERLMVDADTIKEEPGAKITPEVITQQGDASKDLVQQASDAGAVDGMRQAAETAKKLEPQNEEQKKKVGFFQSLGAKIQKAFNGPELTAAEQLDADIKTISHITTSDAGLGGLGSFSSGGVSAELSKRYNIPMSEIKNIKDLQAKYDDMENSNERVEVAKELKRSKLELTAKMTAFVAANTQK